MKTTAAFDRHEISEVAISHGLFAAMQVYIPWLAASRAPFSELAMLSLAQSIVWPLAMIAQLQLRNIYLVEGERTLLPLFVRLRLAGCAFLVVSACLAAGVLRSSSLLFFLVLALALMKCVEIVADIMHAELQRAMEIRRAARSQAYRCAIFVALYTVCLVWFGQLLPSILAALTAMAGWVLLVDLRPGRLWRYLTVHRNHLDKVGPTVRAGLCLSAALALSSLSLMAGRWAALQANDLDTVAATALAGTMASIVAVMLGATQQFSLTQARAQIAAGGLPAFRGWSSQLARRLHIAFAVLTLGWLAVAILAYDHALPVAGGHASESVHDTVIILAGCFLWGGWLNVLCFADTLLLFMMRRHLAILLIALLQVIAVLVVSFSLYPLIGWPAIGIAELVRVTLFVIVVKYATRREGFARHAAG